MKTLIIFCLAIVGLDWVFMNGTLFDVLMQYFKHIGTPIIVIMYIAAIYFAVAMINLMLGYFKEMPLPLILGLEDDGDLGSEYENNVEEKSEENEDEDETLVDELSID